MWIEESQIRCRVLSDLNRLSKVVLYLDQVLWDLIFAKVDSLTLIIFLNDSGSCFCGSIIQADSLKLIYLIIIVILVHIEFLSGCHVSWSTI